MNNDRIFNITGLLRRSNSKDGIILDRYAELEKYLFVPQNLVTDILTKPDNEFNKYLDEIKTVYKFIYGSNNSKSDKVKLYKSLLPFTEKEFNSIKSNTPVSKINELCDKYGLAKIEKLWFMEYIQLVEEDLLTKITKLLMKKKCSIKDELVVSDIKSIMSQSSEYVDIITEKLVYLIKNFKDIYKEYCGMRKANRIDMDTIKLAIKNNMCGNYCDKNGNRVHVDGYAFVDKYKNLCNFLANIFDFKYRCISESEIKKD